MYKLQTKFIHTFFSSAILCFCAAVTWSQHEIRGWGKWCPSRDWCYYYQARWSDTVDVWTQKLPHCYSWIKYILYCWEIQRTTEAGSSYWISDHQKHLKHRIWTL